MQAGRDGQRRAEAGRGGRRPPDRPTARAPDSPNIAPPAKTTKEKNCGKEN